jgi:hypothetical protein
MGGDPRERRCLRLRGLPFSAGEAVVAEFLAPCAEVERCVVVRRDGARGRVSGQRHNAGVTQCVWRACALRRDPCVCTRAGTRRGRTLRAPAGHCTGNAFVVCADEAQAARAFHALNKRFLGHRYIEAGAGARARAARGRAARPGGARAGRGTARALAGAPAEHRGGGPGPLRFPQAHWGPGRLGTPWRPRNPAPAVPFSPAPQTQIPRYSTLCPRRSTRPPRAAKITMRAAARLARPRPRGAGASPSASAPAVAAGAAAAAAAERPEQTRPRPGRRAARGGRGAPGRPSSSSRRRRRRPLRPRRPAPTTTRGPSRGCGASP